MKLKTRIILLIIFVILIAGGITGGVLYLNNNKEEKADTEAEVSWEDAYLKELKNEENFEELKDIKISLCDLNQDEVPELIAFCANTINEYVINIFNIKDNKTEKTEYTFDEEFDVEYMYNVNNEEYNWYIVTEETDTVYELNLEDENKITEASNVKNSNEYIVIAEASKIEFDKTEEETEINKLLETAKNEYITNEELKDSEETKSKIDAINIVNNVKKVDETKGLVYSGLEYETDYYANVLNKTFHYYYEYPVINIDSEDVQEINSEIKEKFGFDEEDEEYLTFWELEVITYDYYINGTILSVVVMEGGNSSTWSATYNIDLKTGEKISNEKLLEDNEVNVETVKNKLNEYANKKIDDSVSEMKQTIGQYWDEGYEKEVTELREDMSKSVDELENIYLNQEGDICIRAEYYVFGGQWTCTKTMEINTKNNEIKLIDFENYFERGVGYYN